MVATAIILAAMYYLKWPVFDMVSKHFIQMVVIGIIAGIVFGIVSHIASRRLPPKLVSHRANTGQFNVLVANCLYHVLLILSSFFCKLKKALKQYFNCEL